ncbi:MAG: DegT/DnrJ/EryC1/StrS family aminotransferase [Acidimicrobiales bacterium]
MIPIARPALPELEDYVALLRRIWDSRMLSNFAEFSRQFEEQSRQYLAVPYALATVSCDIGLIIVLRALELPIGAPCFVSDFTFNSTINAALWAGLTPVIVDVDRRSYNMSATALGIEMDKAESPGVVLATHVFGNPCDVDALKAIADSHGSRLVFDAAHGFGSVRKGVHVGNFGDAEVFSFSGTKPLTMGEGGLIATSNGELAERLRYLRAYGFQDDYRSRYVGLNGKLSELHAALATLELGMAESLIETRLGLVRYYQERLGERVGWQLVKPEDRSTYKDLSIDLGSEREVVETALRRADVQTKRYFVPLHTMDPYRQFARGDNPESDAIHDGLLCLPLFAELSSSDVDRICDVILGALDRQ